MRILTIEIDKEKDLTAVEEFLDNLGVKYHLDDTQALEESIQRGHDQSKNGIIRPHDLVMQEFRLKYQMQ